MMIEVKNDMKNEMKIEFEKMNHNIDVKIDNRWM